jgi:hypothetical protein
VRWCVWRWARGLRPWLLRLGSGLLDLWARLRLGSWLLHLRAGLGLRSGLRSGLLDLWTRLRPLRFRSGRFGSGFLDLRSRLGLWPRFRRW